MQRFFNPRNVLQMNKTMRSTTTNFVARAMSSKDNLTIKSNLEQLTGIRWQELQAEAQGKVSPREYSFSYTLFDFLLCRRLLSMTNQSFPMVMLELLTNQFWSFFIIKYVFSSLLQVPSQHDFRFVGYEDPACHQIRWFELQQGHPHYVPDIGLYFQLLYVPNTLPQNDMVDDIHHSLAH
jgi:hypothetical protein